MAYNVPPLVTADIAAIADISVEDASIFIATAVLVVDEYLSDKGLSDNILRAIAKYLAAHFALVKEGQVKAETLGPTATTYNMTTGLGLKTTVHGQQAIFLDTSGTLFTLDNRKVDESPASSGVATFNVF